MIADRLIGSDEDGGLSLEQRKRTTLGVELAANPSIIFLDGRFGTARPNACVGVTLTTRRRLTWRLALKQNLCLP